MGNKIRFGFDVDDGGAVRKLNGVSKAFDKIGGKGTGASVFGNVTAKAVAVGFNLIADAASRTVDVIGMSITAALEEEESIAKLDAALAANVKGWDGNREAIEGVLTARMALAFSDDEQRASLALLVGATGDVTTALEIQRTAMDLARFKGISLMEASEALTRVEGGQFRILKSLGIELEKGATAQDALTAVQRVASGQADAYSNTLRGKLLTSQIQINEQMEKLGAVIAPPLIAFLSALTGEWLPALGRGWDKVTKEVNDFIDAVDRGIKKLQDFANIQVGAGNAPVLFGPGELFGPPKATGGWVGMNGPEMVMTGEHGPEYITPTHQAVGSGGSGVTIEGVSPRDLARIIDEQLYVTLRRASPTAGRI